MQVCHKNEIRPDGCIKSERGWVDCDRRVEIEHMRSVKMVDASGGDEGPEGWVEERLRYGKLRNGLVLFGDHEIEWEEEA